MENQTSEETQEDTPTEPNTETQEETSAETSEETVEKENPKTSESVNYESKFIASQKEAIRLKKENDELRKGKVSNPSSQPTAPKGSNLTDDIDTIVEIQQAITGLSPEMIAELKLRAKVNDTSLSEARKDENFILLHKAWTEKAEQNKTLSPSTKQSITQKKKTLSEMTLEEKEKALIEMGSSASFARSKKWK